MCRQNTQSLLCILLVSSSENAVEQLQQILCIMDFLIEFLFTPLSTSGLVFLFSLAAVALVHLNTRPKPLQPPTDLNQQTVGIAHFSGLLLLANIYLQGGARRTALLKDDNLISYLYEDAQTLYNVFQRGLRVSAKISTVICDKQDKAETLLDNCEKNLTPVLKTIILMDPYDSALIDRSSKSGVEVLSLKDVEALGKNNHQKPVPPKPEDLSIVCFTSGTTGDPKGAMLTHENVVADAAGVVKTFESVFVPVPSDVSISFLPLAHMFERVVQTVLYSVGGRVGFFQGDIRLLPDDMKALKPTVFPVVPRLLNRVYDKVHSGAQTPFKKWLLNFAIEKKRAEVKQGIIRNDSIWDKLIFHKVQIFEAYGQTECTAACSFTIPGDWHTGHVGVPVPCNIVKLVDVEEMNYFASNGEGEVCVKGKNVFCGYLNDPEKTAEALDKDGWLHTGDIGKWLPSGVLKIIDRKKNIFKLAQGEYIAPEKIENVYIRSAPVAQVFVHGDSLQSSLVAIVVPDLEILPGFAEKLGVKGSLEELCKNQVKDLYLHPDMFTIENGLLTPTLKAKRADLTKFFKVQIESLYANM
ncbi:hypothetical protein cypCar_00043477 [Cyprinus carpio]|nr:hypothetical protein cypCar_00043477 [Cyprinus carpio]